MEVGNLNDEHRRRYAGISERRVQDEVYSWNLFVRRRLALPMKMLRLLEVAKCSSGVGGVCWVVVAGFSRPEATQPASRHVILVSIDGFAAFHLTDSSIDLPNIRALAAAGAAAESSETVFPSVTHPSHTTLVTGVTPRRHGVVDNTVTDRRTGKRFHITNLPRRESVKVPTLFDAVRRGRLKLGRVLLAGDERRSGDRRQRRGGLSRRRNGGADPAAVTPGLLDELRAAGVPIDTYYAFYDDPFGQGAADLALTQAAAHVFRRRTPALTAIHLLVTDDVQHDFGPAHYRSKAALTTADHCVGLLRRAVTDSGLADQTTFVIGADHGFVTVTDEMNVAPLARRSRARGPGQWTTDKWYLFAEQTPRFEPGRDRNGARSRARATGRDARDCPRSSGRGLRGARLPGLRRQPVCARARHRRG